MDEQFDFCGWATKNDLQCSDGRIIRKDAVKHNDGETVPLVWNHDHTDPYRVIGHAKLQNRPEGVYAYGRFNDTDLGKTAKIYVEHGDITHMSIYANQLQQQGPNVLHGAIREVSLVLAGANPGAYIESVIKHGEESEDEAIIFTGEDISLSHAEDETLEEDTELEHADTKKEDKIMAEETKKPEDEKKSDGEETIADVFNTLSEKQKTVVYAMIGQAIEDSKNNKEGDTDMKHNVFDTDVQKENQVLSHSDITAIISDAKRTGSLRDAAIAHNAGEITHAATDDDGKQVTYGVANIDYLFPDARNITREPLFIKRDTGWVTVVMNAVKHSPFSRIKSIFADITADDARAKGYLKGNKKVEEVFTLLKRSTTPTTIYKKQKMDRDDVVDITDFDVVSWIKSEMRVMLDEEIARAILVGDGRSTASDDKINESNIRPIWTDDSLYTIKAAVQLGASETETTKGKKFIKAVLKARKNYKGSGNPILLTTEDVLTDLLLIEDANGRNIYESVDKLATALRVSKIVTSPVLENQTREGVNAVDGDTKTRTLMGIIVNLADYTVGADKGGAVNLFEDFDIDFNQQKYLIETRCSGALTKPYSAIAVEAITEAVGG